MGAEPRVATGDGSRRRAWVRSVAAELGHMSGERGLQGVVPTRVAMRFTDQFGGALLRHAKHGRDRLVVEELDLAQQQRDPMHRWKSDDHPLELGQSVVELSARRFHEPTVWGRAAGPQRPLQRSEGRMRAGPERLRGDRKGGLEDPNLLPMWCGPLAGLTIICSAEYGLDEATDFVAEAHVVRNTKQHVALSFEKAERRRSVDVVHEREGKPDACHGATRSMLPNWESVASTGGENSPKCEVEATARCQGVWPHLLAPIRWSHA